MKLAAVRDHAVRALGKPLLAADAVLVVGGVLVVGASNLMTACGGGRSCVEVEIDATAWDLRLVRSRVLSPTGYVSQYVGADTEPAPEPRISNEPIGYAGCRDPLPQEERPGWIAQAWIDTDEDDLDVFACHDLGNTGAECSPDPGEPLVSKEFVRENGWMVVSLDLPDP